MRQYLSDLASKCQGIAGSISFDEANKGYPPQTKHILLEVSHALDSNSVRVVYPPKGVPLIINARGKERALNWRERLAIILLKGLTEVRP
jgi:hypothetical protein